MNLSKKMREAAGPARIEAARVAELEHVTGNLLKCMRLVRNQVNKACGEELAYYTQERARDRVYEVSFRAGSGRNTLIFTIEDNATVTIKTPNAMNNKDTLAKNVPLVPALEVFATWCGKTMYDHADALASALDSFEADFNKPLAAPSPKP